MMTKDHVWARVTSAYRHRGMFLDALEIDNVTEEKILLRLRIGIYHKRLKVEFLPLKGKDRGDNSFSTFISLMTTL